MTILRRTALVMMLSTVAGEGILSASAATPAETFVSDNIDKGLGILNDKQLSQTQRHEQFAVLLLGITDMRRIAIFTLGRYAGTASRTDQDAFVSSFQHYATVVYQSYFAKYAGQTPKIVSSSERAPEDFVVVTNLIEPAAGRPPLEVDFRIRTDSGRPMLVDFSVAGVWIGLEERDQFAAILSRNKGSIPELILRLDQIASQYN
jgi:phospholipid transport system substrate-binding protein